MPRHVRTTQKLPQIGRSKGMSSSKTTSNLHASTLDYDNPFASAMPNGQGFPSIAPTVDYDNPFESAMPKVAKLPPVATRVDPDNPFATATAQPKGLPRAVGMARSHAKLPPLRDPMSEFRQDRRKKLLLTGERHDDAKDKQFVLDMEDKAYKTDSLRVYREGLWDGKRELAGGRIRGVSNKSLAAEGRTEHVQASAFGDALKHLVALEDQAHGGDKKAKKILADRSSLHDYLHKPFEEALAESPDDKQFGRSVEQWIKLQTASKSKHSGVLKELGLAPKGPGAHSKDPTAKQNWADARSKASAMAWDLSEHHVLEKRNQAMTSQIAGTIDDHHGPHVYSVGSAHLERTKYSHPKELSRFLGKSLDTRSLPDMLSSELKHIDVQNLGTRKQTQERFGTSREAMVGIAERMGTGRKRHTSR